MRAPEFWNHKYGRDGAPFIRTILAPFGWIYGRATARRLRVNPAYDPKIPVISVGNISVGGTGKTPICAYLLESLTRMGLGAVVLSRGYGGREKGPVRVTPKHTSDQVGDETILLAGHGPVWVAHARDDGAKAAMADGAKIIIMDDAHQNPFVRKTLSILVVDAQIGFGNERIFPAGPLREPIKTALERTDLVILMKPELSFEPDEELLAHLKGQLVLSAYLAPLMPPPSGKLYAFAGIGRPNKFFDTLLRAGADLVESRAFPNHYQYKPADLADLQELADEEDALLITTQKDHVRLPQALKKKIAMWPVAVQFQDELTLRRVLHPIITAAGGQTGRKP